MTERHTQSVGALLRRSKDRVVERWSQRVLRDPLVPEANHLPRPALEDHIPALLDRLIRTLDERAGFEHGGERTGRRIGVGTECLAHAHQRFVQGYSMPSALHELSHLRAAILDLCKTEVPSTAEELLLLNAAIDEAMVDAAQEIHKAEQAALQASEERYRLLVESARDYAIFMLDAEGRIASSGISIERLLGYPSEELVGQPIDNFFTPEARRTGALQKAISAATADGSFENRMVLLRKSGAPLWGELTLTPIVNEAGGLEGFSTLLHDATERRQAEQRIAESAARLSSIIASAMDAIVSLDEDLRIIVFNQSAEKIFGVVAADVMGQPVTRFVPQRFREANVECIRRFGDSGATNQILGGLEPLIGMRASGEEFPIEATISQAQVAGQRVFTIVLRDITAQVRAAAERAALLESERAARRAAQESEFKFRRLADSGILGIVIASRNGQIFDANDTFLNMVGHTRDDLAAGRLSWRNMTPPEHAERTEAVMRALKETGSAKMFEKEYLRKDGGRVPVAMGAATLDIEKETSIAYVVDVTARKRAEAALHDVARERDETLALLDTFMATAPVGFAMVDRELRYLRINETLAAMNGLPVATHLGRRMRDVLPSLAPAEALIQKVLDSGEPVIGMQTKAPGNGAGGTLEVLLNLHPIRDHAGRIYAVGGVVLDITEQAQALAEIRRNAAFRERLMAILGHDLRQPLQTVVLTAETWLRHERLPDGLLRSAQRLARAGIRMGRMIADLLDFARVRQGAGLPITLKPIHLGSICRTVVDEIATARPDRQIELVLRGECEGHFDPDRIAQVISNLVGNALDYSPSDTPVFVEVDGFEDQVRLRVSNQGEPIPKDLLPVLFDPFRRGNVETHGAVSKGLGLGLYIAREVVRVHGGSITVTSEPGEGTIFTITLPKAPAEVRTANGSVDDGATQSN